MKTVRNHRLTKELIAVAIATAVIVPNAVLATSQHDSMIRATEVIYVEDVPFNEEYDLKILNNGTTYYENANGERVTEINGLSSDEFARILGYDVTTFPDNENKNVK